MAKCNELKITGLALKKAKLSLIRHSSNECDFDGLVSSFKHVIDGLVVAQVIIDDKSSVIDQPSYSWEFRQRNLGGQISIKIEVEE